MENEARKDPRYWEKSIKMSLKTGSQKERITIDNLSYSGVGFEFPANRKTFVVGDKVNILLKIGSETTAFTSTIKWVSDNTKNSHNYEIFHYGAKNLSNTFSNPGLWKDYITFLELKERFLAHS